MPIKRKAVHKKEESAPEDKPAKTQFVTEVVEDLPVNEGVDVSEEALETIKESAEKIEEVVEEIQEEKKEALSETPPTVETDPVEEKKEEENEILSEIFAKESSANVFPDITERKRTSAAPVFLWAIIIIAVALLTGGMLLVVVSGLPKLPTLFVKPTPPAKQDLAPQGTPTPTPAAPQRSDIKVQVLNGGGTPGSAGKAKTFLEEKGYSVADVGNTPEYTYAKTEILVKSGKDAYLEFLKADLADEYTIGTAAATLPEDIAFDAQVIVGKK
ncbi:MAG: LytR C-terminal domain-containing protein [Patescibacteria group bacterium]